MISDRQKQQLLLDVVRDKLRDGRPPHYDEIMAEVLRRLGDGRSWGEPLTRFRAVISDYTVVSSTELNDLFRDLLFDLQLAYDELKANTELSLSVYEQFSASAAGLRGRLLGLERELATLGAAKSAGGREMFMDTFSDSSKVDLATTTAIIDPEGGLCTLPQDQSKSKPVWVGNATLVSENFPAGGQSYGSILAACSPYSNEGLNVRVPANATYVGTVNLVGVASVPGTSDEVLANSASVDVGGVGEIKLEVSNDSYNWENVYQGAVSRPIKVHFNRRYLSFLRLTVFGTDTQLSVKCILLNDVGYAESAVLYSKQFTSSDSTSPLATISLKMNATAPAGSNIVAYISTSSGGPWTPISDGFVGLTDVAAKKEITSTEQAFAVEVANSRFYKMSHAAITQSATAPLINSGELLWGYNGFYVEAYKKDWSKYGDTYHVPTLDDWTNPESVVRWCIMNDKSTYDISDSWSVLPRSSQVYEFSTGGYISYFGVLVTDSTSANALSPTYNYRFTTWIHSREAKTLHAQNAFCVYVGADGMSTQNKTVATFAIYLNGEQLMKQDQVETSVSLPNIRSADWGLRQGWNKFELLIYRPINPANQGQSAVFVGPNILQSSRDNRFKITDVTAAGPEIARVTEFKLRWSTPVDSKRYWAWAQDSQGTITSVLTNFDPGYTASIRPFDEVSSGSTALTKVWYKHLVGDSNYSLYFRADLTVGDPYAGPPTIYDYALFEVSG